MLRRRMDKTVYVVPITEKKGRYQCLIVTKPAMETGMNNVEDRMLLQCILHNLVCYDFYFLYTTQLGMFFFLFKDKA